LKYFYTVEYFQGQIVNILTSVQNTQKDKDQIYYK